MASSTESKSISENVKEVQGASHKEIDGTQIIKDGNEQNEIAQSDGLMKDALDMLVSTVIDLGMKFLFGIDSGDDDWVRFGV